MKSGPEGDGHGEDVASKVFIAGGEMGRLCREKDWSGTSLGPVEQWPQSLRTAAGMSVAQGIPRNLCWGPDLLQIYNDAYREILADKHPESLGRSVLCSWAEIRDEIEPLFERVLQGETVYFEDLLLRVERNGRLEDAYFTFSYSPVPTETGDVGGVLINALETTQQVRARAVHAERDRLLEALDLERARLEYVFQQAPSFLAVLRGPDHVFELANDAYYQLIGERDLIGRPIREALPEVMDQGFADLLDSVRESGEPFIGREVSVLLAVEPGEPPQERFVDFVYLPILEPDGSRSGVIAHGYDVTEQVHARRQVEQLLQESEQARRDAEAARAEAEAANRAKSDFLASMSHELRTPLNAIGGYADLIDMEIHGPVTDEQRAALQRIAMNQRHLLTLINDILSFAKLEAGRVEFEIRPLQAAALLDSVEPLVAPLANSQDIAYSVTACDPALWLHGDEERVRQILLNLVTNAIKFTPAGGFVALTCTGDGERIHIHVQDNGVGIAEDKQDRIFDPFTQADRRLDHPQAGVGLGLAISRDLARGMGGDLGVVSKPAAGSTFTLTLPACADPAQA
ncbi:MAG TPA: ATP-binding protein [Longimicrobiales bacterium]|nr:ATP-binding protein [Longimicrobiales bacterium]